MRRTGKISTNYVINDLLIESVPNPNEAMDLWKADINYRLSQKLLEMTGDGRTYVVKWGEIEKESSYGESKLWRHVYVVLLNWDDAEVGEEIHPSSLDELATSDRYRTLDKLFKFNGKAWERIE